MSSPEETLDVEAVCHSISALLVSLIALIMFISLFCHFRYNEQSQSLSRQPSNNPSLRAGKSYTTKSVTTKQVTPPTKYFKAIIYSALITIALNSLRMFAIFALHIPLYCPKCQQRIGGDASNFGVQVISAFLLFFNKLIIQVHFIIRLYYAFRGSFLKIKRYIFVILYGLSILGVFLLLLYFIVGTKQLNSDSPLLIEDDFDVGGYEKPFESLISILLLISSMIINFIISMCVTYLFASKLMKLVLNYERNQLDKKSFDTLFEETRIYICCFSMCFRYVYIYYFSHN